jgi:hypothetical protein
MHRLHSLSYALLIAAIVSACPALFAQEETFAEKLGWPKGSRVLILHSDDLGMSHASNVGTIEALEFGMVTSVSMMMPTPWVPEFAKYCKENPNVDVGLHLTLTSEWDDYRWGPVAGKLATPGLADSMGCLWDSVGEVIENATADEVETEIRAQIDRAETMGLKITHIDSHMGTLFSDDKFFERYIKVGIEKDLPMLMAKDYWPKEAAESDRTKRRKVAIVEVWNAGLPVIDYVHTATYSWKTRDKDKLYIQHIRNLPEGITEMIIHCTKPNEVIDVITNSRELLYGDYFSMTSKRVRRVLEKEGIILTTWRELHERRKKYGKPLKD